ncbi:MAG TPA: alkaline phosphatase family protein [Acidimicrobiales bacterium]|nr:alkaline phosphatase family protein [Acidimicrobiales bacterium]
MVDETAGRAGAAQATTVPAPGRPGVSQPGGNMPEGFVLPDYGGACIDSLVAALLAPPPERPDWLPRPVREAAQVVLLVLDGLGWSQLQERRQVAPVLAALEGGAISSVAPTTTATALSSLALGMQPAAHGIVGYKFVVDGPSGPEVLNVLRWSTVSGDARTFAAPRDIQPRVAFGGRPVPVVSRSDFAGTGFTQAHQQGAREVGWVVPSSIAVLVKQLLAQDEPLVYAYYDGIDKVAHANGLGPLYMAELAAADRLVGELVASLPEGSALAVTADHGQVAVGARAMALDPVVAAMAPLVSGEARFRWLHSRPGGQSDLLEAARSIYGGQAWVASQEEVLNAGVLGGFPDPRVRARLGDVLLVPAGEHAYLDPRDATDARLVCRHGGLSPAEMLVPLLGAGRGT